MAPKDASKVAVDELTAAQAKAEHARLEAEIAAHDRRYYAEDAPTITDADYDALRRRYEAIEAAFPGRFTRDANHMLIGIDQRPINFAESETSQSTSPKARTSLDTPAASSASAPTRPWACSANVRGVTPKVSTSLTSAVASNA